MASACRCCARAALLALLALLGCSDPPKAPAPSLRSLLLGVPPIPCARDLDCPAGRCGIDGCPAVATNPSAAIRRSLVNAVAARLRACGSTCARRVESIVEEELGNALVPSARKARLIGALAQFQDHGKALTLARQALDADSELLQLAALRFLGDRGNRAATVRLRALFEVAGPSLRLALLSRTGEALGAPKVLCSLAENPAEDLALRARALEIACAKGERCAGALGDLRIYAESRCAGSPRVPAPAPLR